MIAPQFMQKGLRTFNDGALENALKFQKWVRPRGGPQVIPVAATRYS